MHGRNPRVQQHAEVRRRDPLVDAAVGANRVGNQPVVPARAVGSEESPHPRRVLAQEAHIGRIEIADFGGRRLIQPARRSRPSTPTSEGAGLPPAATLAERVREAL